MRVSLEWLFGNIIVIFKFSDFKNQKIGLKCVGKSCYVSALFTNAYTYVSGNNCSRFVPDITYFAGKLLSVIIISWIFANINGFNKNIRRQNSKGSTLLTTQGLFYAEAIID